MPEPITREETFLAAAAGESVSLPTPVTREELYLAKLAGQDVETPTPVTRKEMFLEAAAQGGGGTDVSDTTATAADVLSGKAFYLADGTKTNGTIQSQAAQTIMPTTADQIIAAGKYLTGAQTVKGDANLLAGNIKNGVSIFGVTGSFTGGDLVIKTPRVSKPDYSIYFDDLHSFEDIVALQFLVNGVPIPGLCAFIASPRIDGSAYVVSSSGTIAEFLLTSDNVDLYMSLIDGMWISEFDILKYIVHA